ncbi:MAG: 6,7-dimethyl-8-ribityllumazine synthase [Proteobacteria bacterium]|jgi:6,7-dimethyl-8-ribityllumazine synthase|nr:6,7-dimethyl-8-ribityllumazine synthase [Pseudomonadota bacterium]MDA0942030.1 6,7-dimethyl-8-ribityllumazine synthase [Pseudomonadota bacterium]MDA1034098.1 6,7-dimethyl-8-ribityllumazine synthase [Pseudomonadota bacterium]
MENKGISNLQIGLCISKFNYEYVSQLEKSIVDELLKKGIDKRNIFSFYVPGALELPLLLSRCCKANKFDALIAVGAVIRGETYHFEIVSDQSALGLMNVQLQNDILIMNAILTTNNDAETKARVSSKGVEVVNGLFETLETLNQIL